MNFNLNTDLELTSRVMFDKATELPFSGQYNQHADKGCYLCKNCATPLYESQTKFLSHCGWPSFDDEIVDSIKRVTDADGRRVEIQCNYCGIHLGHVFEGEYLTSKNLRHCVNSVSLDFVSADLQNIESCVVGCGCFWGVQYYLQKLDGVIATRVGYAGGSIDNPTYKQVCAGNTGHFEVIKIIYDKNKIDYESLIKYFYEIHDFEQTNGQGNDVGSQYLSVIMYSSDEQKQIIENIISTLENKNYKVYTNLIPTTHFWPAELYHQDYYLKNNGTPYCHFHKKIF